MKDYGFAPLPGDLYRRWPKTEAGEPVPPVFLAHRPSRNMADTMLVGLLGAYGIPAVSVPPGDGAFGKVMLGISGTGNSIFVPETQYNEAKELMEETENGLQSGI